MTVIASGRVEFLQECIVDAYNIILNMQEVYSNKEMAKDIFNKAFKDETIRNILNKQDETDKL